MSDQKSDAKLLFINDEGEAETLWAMSLGSNKYRLDNTPWSLYGLSYGDIVKAVPKEEGSLPEFVHIIEKSGNRTLRLILDPPASESKKSKRVLKKILDMGCRYEGANPKFFGIDVPANVDLHKVCKFLTKSGYKWEHADPTYEELYPDQ